jgi:hypothetical protein
LVWLLWPKEDSAARKLQEALREDKCSGLWARQLQSPKGAAQQIQNTY